MLQYTTGTINQPDSGSVGTAMANKIRDDLIAHAAWELVEEFTPASGTVRWYVMRCLAAVSGLPNDFYVVIGRTLATGELRFAIGEDYTTGSKTLGKYGYRSGSGINFDANGYSPTTYVLGTIPMSGSTNIPSYAGWVPSGTSTKWWLIVDDDGFTVAFNGASNSFVHVGAYTPLTQLPILSPLQMISFDQNQGVITSNPAVANLSESAAALTIEGGGGANVTSYGDVLGFIGDLRYNDALQGDQRPVAEVGMHIYDTSRSSVPVRGWVLGKQKRMRVSQNPPAGFAFGDAYALNGTLWVPYKPDDPRVWDTGVATS